jgi:hypothetical protein
MARRRYDVQGELFNYLNIDMDPFDFADQMPQWAAEAGVALGDEPQVEDLTEAQLKSFHDWLVENENQFIGDIPPELVPSYVFLRSPRKLPKGSWLVHFTNADPFKAFDRGATIMDGLHLTVGGGKTKVEDRNYNISDRPGSYERVYGFAFGLAREGAGRGGPIDLLRYAHDKYGENIVLFQSDMAVEAYHGGDEEYQAIFPIGSDYNAVPLRYRDGRLYGQTESGDEVEFDSLADVLAYVKKEGRVLVNPYDPLVRIR